MKNLPCQQRHVTVYNASIPKGELSLLEKAVDWWQTIPKNSWFYVKNHDKNFEIVYFLEFASDLLFVMDNVLVAQLEVFALQIQSDSVQQ